MQFHDNFHVRSSVSTRRSFHSALAHALESREGTPEEVVFFSFYWGKKSDFFQLITFDIVLDVIKKVAFIRTGLISCCVIFIVISFCFVVSLLLNDKYHSLEASICTM